MTEVLYTISEAAELLTVSERWVRRAIFEKRIAYIKVGKHVRIPESAIELVIEQGRRPAEIEQGQRPAAKR